MVINLAANILRNLHSIFHKNELPVYGDTLVFRFLIIGTSFITIILCHCFSQLKKEMHGGKYTCRMGRSHTIPAIKMIIVPKFNFLFQAVSILPQCFQAEGVTNPAGIILKA